MHTQQIDVTNFMHATLANWVEIAREVFEAKQLLGATHYTSASGSVYFELGGVMYRQSDHWNACVADCAWFLDGKTISRLTYGQCSLADFKPMALACAQPLGLSDNSMAGFAHILQKRAAEPSRAHDKNDETLG